MTKITISIFEFATYVSGILILIIGALLMVSILLFPIWYLLNKVIYQRVQGSVYFLSYVMNRKEFAEWHKENRKSQAKR